MQGVFHCATNHVGCLRFNSRGMGGVKPFPAPEATVLTSRAPPPHSIQTPQQPQLLPYHSVYTFHKVNVYDIYTQSAPFPQLHKHPEDSAQGGRNALLPPNLMLNQSVKRKKKKKKEHNDKQLAPRVTLTCAPREESSYHSQSGFGA